MQLGFISTTLFERKLLFLGQAKCYQPETVIDRPEVDKVHGQFDLCLGHYDGNPKPPKNRVPDDYYRRDELCLRLMFTTAGFSDGALSQAGANDIELVDGRRIAEILVYKGIGVTIEGDKGRVDLAALRAWVSEHVPDLKP